MTRDELVEEFLLSFSRMHRQDMLVNKKVDALRQGERAALFCIQSAQEGAMKSTDVAAALNIAAPSVTLILNKLEEKGFIKRTANARDRREVIVSLTAEGTRVLDEAVNELKGFLGGLTDFLGEDDSKELLRLINRMQQYYIKQSNN